MAHGYADDTQLHLSFRPVSSAAEDLVVKAMESCIEDVRAWLVCNKLLFNASRTELLIIGSRKQLSKISISSIRVGNCDIKSQDSVRNFSSWFDNHLSMSTHIGKLCSKAFRGLYNIRQIRKYLSEDSTCFCQNSDFLPIYTLQRPSDYCLLYFQKVATT